MPSVWILGLAGVLSTPDVATLHDELARLREHPATEATRRLAAEWSGDAVAALAPLPEGTVREAQTRFAHVVVDRSR